MAVMIEMTAVKSFTITPSLPGCPHPHHVRCPASQNEHRKHQQDPWENKIAPLADKKEAPKGWNNSKTTR